jgi:hemolysin III
MKVKPLLRGHFHQAMFFVSLGACIPLILRCTTALERTSAIIYSVGVFAMFGVSSLYHRVTWTPEQRAIWKKFDHAAIYIMIAGSFTPITLLAMDWNSGKTLLITVWILAAVGSLQSIFFVKLPRIVSSGLYLIMGYLLLPYISEIYHSIGALKVWLLVAGGVSYSMGALVYGLKRPVLNPKVFSYHEVFHVLVNVGAVFHFIVVDSLIS